MVDAQGQNLIAVAPGSNRRLAVADIQGLDAGAFTGSICLTQLETPLEAVEYSLRRALQVGMTTILNPAPGRPLTEDFLALPHIITPNETEATLLSGVAVRDVETAQQAGERLLAGDIEQAVIGFREALPALRDSSDPNYQSAAIGVAAMLGDDETMLELAADVVAARRRHGEFGRLPNWIRWFANTAIITFAAVIGKVLSTTLVAYAFALAGSGFFPALVMGIFWKRANKQGAIAGMVVGFLTALVLIVIGRNWGIYPLGVREIGSGLFGVTVGFVVIWAVSLMYPPPDRATQDLVEEVRYPKGTTMKLAGIE